jgi:hypothetical protein
MFKKLSKQDRQGVRKPSDVERKYGLGEVVETVRVIKEESVPENVLDGYYNKGETDYKITALREDLEAQISGIVESDDYRIVDGVTEWYNPPMALDTEYRLTERWLGKPVYTKAVMQDVSQRGNTEGADRIEFSVDTPNYETCIKYTGYTKGDYSNVTIPFMYDGAFIGVSTMNESTIYVDVQNKLFLNNTQLYIQVWYTKTE